MARLIDSNDVYSLFDKSGFARLHVSDIDTIPRVDAVQVVRCKDCKYRKKQVCANPSAGMWVGVELRDDDYCSYGERRNDG